MSHRTETSHKNNHPLVQPIHTAVKGRARFKVNGLYHSESLKQHLEFNLAKDFGIVQVRANPLTGNILVFFAPNRSFYHIATQIERLVLDYRKQGGEYRLWSQEVGRMKLGAEAQLALTTIDRTRKYIVGTDLPVVSTQERVKNLPKDRSNLSQIMVYVENPLAAAQGQKIAPWHLKSADSIIADFKTSKTAGLSSKSAREKLKQYGENVLSESVPRSGLSIFIDQFKSLPVGLLTVAAACSVVTGGVADAVVIMGVVVINAIIGYATESKSEKIIHSLKSLVKPSALAIRDGTQIEISAAEVVPGDILVLKPGSYVAADARLIEANRLSVDESALTGESMPVNKTIETLVSEDVPLGDRANMVYMGTLVTGGQGYAVVVATGKYTEMGKIQTLVGEAEIPETPMQKQLDQAGNQLVLICGAVCGVVFAIGLWRGYGFLEMLKTSISLAVAAVPEGLPAVATTTLALGIAKMRQHNVLIRRLDAVETLGSVQVICMDKTGTLTANKMSVVEVCTNNQCIKVSEGQFIRLLPTKLRAGETPTPQDFEENSIRPIPNLQLRAGETPTPQDFEENSIRPIPNLQLSAGETPTPPELEENSIRPIPNLQLRAGETPTPQELEEKIDPYACDELLKLIHVSVLCNESEVNGQQNGEYVVRGSATENALIHLAIGAGVNVKNLREKYPLVDIKHRSETQNYMTTLHLNQHHQLLAVKGSPTEVLDMCSWQIKDGEIVPLAEADRLAIETENDRMAGKALRVLGVAYAHFENGENLPASPIPPVPASSSSPPENLIWLGLIGMADPIRSGVKALIGDFHQAGIETVMITGDQSPTAYAIGKELNLSQGEPLEIIDSTQLGKLDPEVMKALCDRIHIFARISPANKLQIVQSLQSAGKVVAMTGDGINDAPALKAADVGVAMGHTGTDVAREVADVVLQDDKLETTIIAVSQGRTIYNNIRKSVHFLLSTNMSEIIVMLTATAGGIGQPLNAVQLLWLNLVTDIFPGLALALEQPEPDVLSQPPRNPDEPIIKASDFKGILLESATISASSLAAYGYALSKYGIGPQASTIGFMSLTSAQLLHALYCRSKTHSIYSGKKLPPNQYLTLALGGSFALQILAAVVPGLRGLLQIAPINIVDTAVIGTSAVLPLLLNEATKELASAEQMASSHIMSP
ncbi:cation-transporting ATPase [Microseira wollei NIES-4236]|uniref:Cation-transporting ATPase n=2 Tax=Microseira wollei TaxID=467598 RepID=A0AAV3X7J1_9CYAN|nr:HAD-IC family P-type ATPase [Microseira wollei]GET37775.1 cation-transporting ATPase [Microseira wollei NIES-4236]